MAQAERLSIFLTQDELVELTGRKSARHQLEWLDLKGWKHEENAAGRPIVSRAYAEYRLGGGPAPEARRLRPNLTAADNA
ncbi:MAG: DUF4224 domain-containing protein [Rhodocyclaceae bacterium]|nr:MAG: DUF4224 domain-containing protein [Rhodocyclaceae bacterium]